MKRLDNDYLLNMFMFLLNCSDVMFMSIVEKTSIHTDEMNFALAAILALSDD